MLTHNYSYKSSIADAVKANWKIEDIIGGDKKLDFSKPFLPETLARVRGLTSLSEREQTILNQIRGYSYLYIFGFLEHIIVPFALDHARAVALTEDLDQTLALTMFSAEEAKHIRLFERFCDEFVQGFGSPCGVVPGYIDAAKHVLSHSPLAVTLFMLVFEWMTQQHYIDSVKDDQDLDKQFKELLRAHWVEEAQHTKWDVLMIEKMVSENGPEFIAKGFEGFASIGMFAVQLLEQTMALDLQSFETAIGRKLGAEERQQIEAVQRPAYRYTFLVSGLLHKNFLRFVDELNPGTSDHIKGMAQQLMGG